MNLRIGAPAVHAGNERVTLPERLSASWALALLYADVLAVLVAAYFMGLRQGAAPALCVLVCGVFWLFGIYRTSYAVHRRDEAYVVFVAALPAALLVYGLLVFVEGERPLAAIATSLLAYLLIAPAHMGLHAVRRRSGEPAKSVVGFVSPEAQWRASRFADRASKRILNLAGAAAGILLLSPVMAAAAIAILIDNGAPIFFRQERVGRCGRPFRIFKFRTMRKETAGGWAEPGDARITRIGAWLRRTSIDELPQLFNVLRGEMSLVGPRPEMHEYAAEFRKTIPHYDERHIVEPGITGWAQIHCRRNLRPSDMHAVVPYDLFYVEHASRTLDLIVIVKTAVEFLFHRAV